MAGRRTALLLAVLVLAGCSQQAPAKTSLNGLVTGADPGVAHIHGLGVDPADGVLYAATHYGLFRLPAKGKAVRVAERFQDTMGFTVVGPRTFLGSGHPDFRKDPQLPPRLGLIRSSNAGESWSNVSLSGKADFHVLRFAHDAVYGFDSTSGQLMVSSDAGQRWETRSTLPLRDFVVSPSNAELLLGTTERGLVISTDGGRQWRVLPGVPPMVVLAWGGPDQLYGVTPDGAVLRSVDSGRSFAKVGRVEGQPESIAVTEAGTALYVAVSDKGVLVSADGGKTFTVRYAA